MKKLLISGGNGRLATQFKKYNTEYEVLSPSASDMDVSNYSLVDDYISKNNPDIFLHCGALTKPMIVHEKQPSTSIRVNIIGTSNVVLACKKYNIKLVYISTDYVYPGVKGDYTEKDALKPFNKYGWSKLGGECAVQLYDNSLILRIAMINKPFEYSHALEDVKRSLIYEDDVAKVCLKLFNKKGIINVGNKGKTVYEFAKESNPNIIPISKTTIKDTNMPDDCSMNTKKLNNILSK
jgi:dTDP-4-dehydrorhamnose reductase